MILCLRDAAKLHAPHHEIDPSAMSPVKPRLSETGGRKSCGSGKEWKEKGQSHEWVEIIENLRKNTPDS